MDEGALDNLVALTDSLLDGSTQKDQMKDSQTGYKALEKRFGEEVEDLTRGLSEYFDVTASMQGDKILFVNNLGGLPHGFDGELFYDVSSGDVVLKLELDMNGSAMFTTRQYMEEHGIGSVENAHYVARKSAILANEAFGRSQARVSDSEIFGSPSYKCERGVFVYEFRKNLNGGKITHFLETYIDKVLLKEIVNP